MHDCGINRNHTGEIGLLLRCHGPKDKPIPTGAQVTLFPQKSCNQPLMDHDTHWFVSSALRIQESFVIMGTPPHQCFQRTNGFALARAEVVELADTPS
jgi:hypothetical protein